MKKNLFILVFLTLISIDSYSQKLEKIKGNKIITTTEYAIENFNKLVVGETFNIEIKKGEIPYITIITDSNIHDAIDHFIVDGVLTLHYNKRISTRKKPIITITFTDELNSIELRDKAELKMVSETNSKEFSLTCSEYSKGTLLINCDDFSCNSTDKSEINLNLNSKSAKLNISKSSEFKGNINTKSIEIKQSNKSNIKLKGKATEFDLTITNKSDFDGVNFNSSETTLLAKDYTDVKIKSSSKLTLDLSGSSRIYIYGSPKIVVKEFKNNASIFKK